MAAAAAAAAAALALAPAAAAGCGAGYVADASAPTGCALKLLQLVPYTQSPGWKQVLDVAQLAAAHVNAADGAVVGAAAAAAAAAAGVRLAGVPADTEYGSRGAIGRVVAEAPVAGAVGAARSASSMPVAYLGAAQGFPQLSYWSTSPQLSSLDSFPFFMRTIPMDDLAVRAVAALLRHYGWQAVGVVFINDGYGSGYASALGSYAPDFGARVVSSAR